MKLCGCFTIQCDSRNDPKSKCVERYFLKCDLPTNKHDSKNTIKTQKDRTESNTNANAQSITRQYILKNQSSPGSINQTVLRDNQHNVSKRRSVTFATDSEIEQLKFLRLNKTKRGSIDELQLNEHKRAQNSSNVNHSITRTINTTHETTTCDELDNSQEKKVVVRRRKRSKSPRKQLPSEILDAIKFDLVESIGLDENQLKTIPYENIKTSSQPIRISLSSYSSRQQGRRRSSPFSRSSNVVYSASTHMLYYQAQPTVISTAHVKSTKDTSLIKKLENSNITRVQTLDVQENERVRLECTLTSSKDAEEVTWMRIKSPHNPDILTYRDSVVYAPDRIELEQRRFSSSRATNGTLIETYFLTLIILHPTIDDQGRYICARGRTIFAEYDLFVIVPTQFVDDDNFMQQRTVLEGSALRLSCSANGRPTPSITWYYRANNDKLISLSNGTVCQAVICELDLRNYTRYDPKIIECIADNEKSTRISKVIYIDVIYPPKLTTNVRTLIGSRSMDVFLECFSDANPTSSITWLDENRQEINDHHFYTKKITNQSSILSFSVISNEYPNVLYYCHSNNSIGTVEKLVDISAFIDFDLKSYYEYTTTRISITHPSRKQKTVQSFRTQSKSTMTIITTTVTSRSSISYYSTIQCLISIICMFLI